MAHVGDIQGAAVLALARGRLERYPGEHTRGAFWNGPTTVQTRDECLAYANHQFDIRLQRGYFGDDPEKIAEARRSFVFHHVQHHPNCYRSSADWRAFLAAVDAQGWSMWAGALEGEGRYLHADAVVATVRWFDPSRTAESIRGPRAPDILPLTYPVSDPFRSHAFRDRHWHAWNAKHRGYVALPMLMENECDENFSIRTRIYRSLGQIDHLAAVPALREGLHDPVPFARAQAARALGWLYEPTTIDALRAMARRDHDAEVRRSAELAVQRIVGYWTLFGEWNDVAGSPSRAVEAMRELAERGLAGFALEVPAVVGIDARAHPELAAIRNELRPHRLEAPTPVAPERSYPHHFPAAERHEAMLDRADVKTVARLLQGGEVDLLHGLDIVGRHLLRAYESQVAALVEAPGALGWTARRTMRRLGRGAWLRYDAEVGMT
jgi:hypothetical protein